ETFLDAQRDFAQFHENSEAELLAWLRRLLLNNLGHFVRRYRDTHSRSVAREVQPPADSSSNTTDAGPAATMLSPSGQAIEQEQAQELQRALQRLPEDYRQVITLRYLEGLTFEEIGPRMNRSADAVRKLWSRAMDRLRQEWNGPP